MMNSVALPVIEAADNSLRSATDKASVLERLCRDLHARIEGPET